MTIEKLITGIAVMLRDEFKIPVYTERIEQDLDPPCFLVRSFRNRNDKRLMWRYRHDIDIEVVFFPSEVSIDAARGEKAEMNDVSDRLMYLLRMIEADGEKILTRSREAAVSDGALVMTFSVTIYEREVRDPDIMKTEHTQFKNTGWNNGS